MAKSRIADTFIDMKALAVLYAGRLSADALEPVFPDQDPDRNALQAALARARAFPDVLEVVLLVGEGVDLGVVADGVRLYAAPSWGKRRLLDALAELSSGYDLVYYAWADCPLLDPALAAAIRDRHLRYAAEYSYADGWPYGFAPELLSPGTAAVLAQLAGDDQGPVERDALFAVLQKDINSFDIETELSSIDLRRHRLTLAADSRRNLLLLRRLSAAGIRTAADAERLIEARADLLRTLPAFYALQIAGPCVQSCALCPYPRFGAAAGTGILERRDFMELPVFEALLDRIIAFSGDAVVDLSVWGEASLHPDIQRIVQAVLDRPALSLVLETVGIGWKPELLAALASAAAAAAPRLNHRAPLSWIVALDSDDPRRYAELRGAGYAEAVACARQLQALFPADTYVQALRIKGYEEDLEKFYRTWKANGAQVIVQKYDDFCGYLPSLKASDLSPVQRQPCWHLMRDLTVLIDGTVPLCREDVAGTRLLGNAFTDPLPEIWSRAEAVYRSHLDGSYPGLCAVCDEYYTYNF